MTVAVRWFCSQSLLSDMLDELGSAEPFNTLISTTPFSSGTDSEFSLLDKEEEEEDEGSDGAFFFLGFLMTPVLHLDFLCRL